MGLGRRLLPAPLPCLLVLGALLPLSGCGEEQGPFFGAVSDAQPTAEDLAPGFQRSWMLVLFLQEHGDGRCREGFERHLQACLSRETRLGAAQQAFGRCLQREEADGARLDADSHPFVDQDLLQREPP